MTALHYRKMHGTGNRILVIDNRETKAEVPTPEALRKIAGIAVYDQLMWLEDPRSEDAVASYRVFNADGSEAGQCGNGLRCIAWVLGRYGDETFKLDSPAGPVFARVVDDFRTAVSMGRPVFDPVRVPFVTREERLRYPLDVQGERIEVAVLSMGNPHCVLDVDDVQRAPVERVGPAIETHECFPDKVNVGFRQIVSPTEIRLRVFERGVGETLACGTGAAAAVVSGIREERLEMDVAVGLPGGQVMVSWHGDDVWLTGDVEFEHEGSIDL